MARTLRKKRCSRGHLKSGDNLYISPDGQNICRTCVRENQARWRDEKREQYRAYHREAERNKRAKNSSSTPSMSTFPTDGTHESPFIPRGSGTVICTAAAGLFEREFGRLKTEYALTPLRVRGLERVQLHADLTMLSRLAQALSRARGHSAGSIGWGVST